MQAAPSFTHGGVPHFPEVQTSGLQHWLSVVQVPPLGRHCCGRQFPYVVPATGSQMLGLQQSPSAVHFPSVATHGARQTCVVVSQTSGEQHWLSAVQLLPGGMQAAHAPLVAGGLTEQRFVQHWLLAVQAAPEAVHEVPDARLHPAGGIGASVQASLPSMFSQVSPVQQSVDTAQDMPRVKHPPGGGVGVVQ